MTVVLTYSLSPKPRNVWKAFPCVSGVKYGLRNAMQWRHCAFKGDTVSFNLSCWSPSPCIHAHKNVLLRILIHILNTQEMVTSPFCILSSHPCSDQPSKRLKPSIWEDFDVLIEMC